MSLYVCWRKERPESHTFCCLFKEKHSLHKFSKCTQLPLLCITFVLCGGKNCRIVEKTKKPLKYLYEARGEQLLFPKIICINKFLKPNGQKHGSTIDWIVFPKCMLKSYPQYLSI
jgi:hypothetical protein